jgi:hypothetical protein
VTGVRQDGVALYRWLRHGAQYVLSADGQDEERRAFAFAEGLTYEACVEDAWSVFPLDASVLPQTLDGFLMYELVIHPAFFGALTSRTHAAVDRLRRVGDSVVMPMSGNLLAVDFGGFISIRLQRGESVLTFDGLSQYEGTPAALLSADCPQTFPEIQGTGRGRGDVTAKIWVGLEGEGVLQGTFQQTNYLLLPGPDGAPQPLNQIVRGTLRRIRAEDYPR